MRITGAEATARQQAQDDVLALIKTRAAAAQTGRDAVSGAAKPHAAQASTAQGTQAQTEVAVEQINAKLKLLGTNLQFAVDKETGITVVKVIDRETSEVLRQIPSEATIQIARSLDKLVGHLLNQSA